MVQPNLFAGQELRHTHREWVCGHREVGGGDMESLGLTDVGCHGQSGRLVGACCIAQGSLLMALQ